MKPCAMQFLLLQSRTSDACAICSSLLHKQSSLFVEFHSSPVKRRNFYEHSPEEKSSSSTSPCVTSCSREILKQSHDCLQRRMKVLDLQAPSGQRITFFP